MSTSSECVIHSVVVAVLPSFFASLLFQIIFFYILFLFRWRSIRLDFFSYASSFYVEAYSCTISRDDSPNRIYTVQETINIFLVSFYVWVVCGNIYMPHNKYRVLFAVHLFFLFWLIFRNPCRLKWLVFSSRFPSQFAVVYRLRFCIYLFSREQRISFDMQFSPL